MILASVHHPFLPLHVFAIYSVGNRMPPVKCVLSVTSKRFFESWWCHINYSTALRRWGCLSNKLLDRPKVQHFLCTRWNDYLLSFHAQQPWKARTSSLSRIHDHIQLNTPQSVGLLWTSDQSDAETSTWQHTTLTRDRYLCPRRDSNPHSQQSSRRIPRSYTARPLWLAIKRLRRLKIPNSQLQSLL